MATFQKLPSGNWRVLIRRKKSYASETFRRRYDAEIWALDMERRVDRNESISVHRPKHIKTFANLVDLHISDMHEVQKPLRRSKGYALKKLKVELGKTTFDGLDREQLITYGRKRAKEGAGPVTLGAELSYINTVITHAAAVHGITVSKEQVDLARVALRRLGLVGRGVEFNHSPSGG